MDWFYKVLKSHYADFEGRARRKEFWMYNLIYLAGCIAFGIIMVALSVISPGLSPVFAGIAGIVYLALLIPTIAVFVRRMHDLGKSGWCLLIPIYNIILATIEGEEGCNRYGLDPKEYSI